MFAIELKSKDLSNLICKNILGKKNDTITDVELQKIDQIAINRYNISHKITDMNFEDLIFLSELETLIISNFKITDEEISKINKLTKLKNIQFTNCIFDRVRIKFIIPIEKIIVEASKEFKLEFIGKKEKVKMMRILSDNDLSIEKISEFINLEKIYLQECNIKKFGSILNADSIEYINIDGSNTDNTDVVEVLKNNKRI